MKDLIYKMNDRPKRNSPSAVIKKSGMTATIRLGNEEVQVVNHDLILNQTRTIEAQEKRIRNLEEHITKVTQSIRQLQTEFNNLKKNNTSIINTKK